MHGNIPKTTFKKFVAIALSLLLAQPAFGQSALNQYMAFEGTLTDNAGNPINIAGATLNFYVTALDPAPGSQSCYLFGESSISAGDSLGNIVHRFGTGTVLSGVFSQNLFFGNASGTISTGAACNVDQNAVRRAQVMYSLGPGQNIAADINLGTVPYAQNAAMLSGKSASDFVAVTTDTNTVFTGGTNGQYLTKSTSGVTWSTLSLTSTQITDALGYIPTSSSGTVTTSGITAALGYTPANSATTTLKSNNLADLTSATAARSNLGLGSLAIKNSIDLATAEATGTLAVARLPSFTGDITNSVGSASTTVVSLRGFPLSTSAPTSGQVMGYFNNKWGPGNITITAVTNVSSSNSDITITASSTTPVLTLNAGNNPGQIMRLSTSSTAPVSGQVLRYNGSGWIASTENVGAGGSSTMIVGTTSGTVAAGDDSRITGALQKTNNLSDLTSSATARTSLGLGSLALKSSVLLTSDVSGVLPVANGGSHWTQVVSGAYTLSNIGIGTVSPTARLHIAGGSSTLPALKISSGTLLSAPVAGAIESDGTNLYFTDNLNVRRTLNSAAAATSVDNASTINSDTNITLNPLGGSVIVSATTASTNPSNGALVVKGGLGVNGNSYFSSNLYSAGSISASGTIAATNFNGAGYIKTTGLISTTGNIAASGSISTIGNMAASGSVTASSFISQLIYGSTTNSGSLYIESTTDSTKGNIVLGASGGAIGIGAAPLASSSRLEIKSKGIGSAGSSYTSVMRPTAGSGFIADYEGSGNNFITEYYDSAGLPRIKFAANTTNYITNNFVVGSTSEIGGTNSLSVHGNTAISGSTTVSGYLSVSKTLILGGATSSTAPLVFAVPTITSGTTIAGALEFDGTDFLFTNTALQRRRIAGGSVSGTIDNIHKVSYSVGALTLEGNTASVNPAVIINNAHAFGTVALQVNNNMVVSGSIKLSSEGVDTANTCVSGDTGKQRYNKTYKAMEYCDGTNWRGIQGVTSCPTGLSGTSFTLIGKEGTGDAFCMSSSHFAATTYFDAVDQCALKTSYLGAGSRVCSEPELNMTCKAYNTSPAATEGKVPGFGSSTTKYWIPADGATHAIDMNVTTNTSCNVNSSATTHVRGDATTNSYRCCYQ
jgi:hypothetical protein